MATGKPVPNVRLWHWQHPGIEGRTDDEGLVTISAMPEGEFTFMVEAPDRYILGWSDESPQRWKDLIAESRDEGSAAMRCSLEHGVPFDLTSGMPQVTISLEPGVTISGRVLDPDGKPVAGATVAPARSGTGRSYTGDTRFSVATKEDGTFQVVLPPTDGRKYNLIVHDGKYQEWRTWANGVGTVLETVAGQRIENLELRLTRPGIIRGRTVDGRGRPVAGVYVQTRAEDRLEHNYYNPATRSDKDGNFELPFVRPGRHLVHGWVTGSEDEMKATFPVVEVRAGETTTVGDVVIPRQYQDRS
jgi:protocatechuate 3,4-dioxygenase beta subunit